MALAEFGGVFMTYPGYGWPRTAVRQRPPLRADAMSARSCSDSPLLESKRRVIPLYYALEGKTPFSAALP